MATMQMTVPTNMYGLRRPKREVELSANVPNASKNISKGTAKFNACLPMSGCMMRPDKGPATKTIAILDFDKPSERRYGEALGAIRVIS
jgi:hypothetical protein